MKKENMIAAMMFGGQAGGGGLPSVTDADDGKLLVAENGQWISTQLYAMPRYLLIELDTSDGETFTVRNSPTNHKVEQALYGGYSIDVICYSSGSVIFEAHLPPLNSFDNILFHRPTAAFTSGIANGSLSLIFTDVNVDVPDGYCTTTVLYSSQSTTPEVVIDLTVTDPNTYSGTADITQNTISTYASLGISFAFRVAIGGYLITFKAIERLNDGTWHIGGLVYLPGVGLAYIETSGSTFTTTPLVTVSP